MQTTRLLYVAAIVAVTLTAPPFAAAAPYGDPFPVHELDSDLYVYQSSAGANGDVAVLWATYGGMFVSRFDATGRPLQSRPLDVESAESIAVSGTGSFAVVSQTPNGSGSDIVVRVYDRAGNPTISPTIVNPPNPEQRILHFPRIAMNARGQFAVVWQRWSASGSGTTATEVYMRRYEATGMPSGTATLVRGAPMRVLSDDIGIDDRGNVAVVWTEVVGNGATADLYGRRYAATGAPLSSPFLIIWDATQIPRLAMNGAGAFVVVTYRKTSASSPTWGVIATRFSASGAQLGAPLNVNVQPSDSPHVLDVGIAADGGFVAAWRESTAGTPGAVLMRSYDANGVALEAPTPASVAGGTREFGWSEIAVDPAGNATVVWDQRESQAASDRWRVHARRFTPASVSVTPLVNGQTVSGLSGATASWRYFKIRVEPGQTTLDVTMFGSGDADLYLRLGALPNLNQWDGRPYLNGSNEAVRMRNFPPGDWYIGVRGYTSYTAVSLTARAY